jgi:hypothetical protein
LDIDTNQPFDIWLGELALSSKAPAHQLFALDTMFQGTSLVDDPRRLIRLTGATDVFGIDAADELRKLIFASTQGRAR